MGPWKLELLRLVRTRRLIALAALFLILGLGGPVLVHYLPDLVKRGAQSGIQVIVPKPKPVDGIQNFASNISSLGTLVVVVVGAATVSLDANPVLSMFYRTRIRRPTRLILPRYLSVTAACLVCLALGTFGAWYETTVLIGPIAFGPLLGGFLLEATWLCFVMSVVTAFSSVVRGVLGVVGGSITFLLALALLENIPSTQSWFPTRLAQSAADLVQHPAGDVWHAVVVAGLGIVFGVAFAVNRLGAREV